MTQGELFAGIGGFGLAGRWCGIESVFQVEIDLFCQKVLKKNFPNAQLFGDIKEFDGKPFAGTIDIVSGGFPCQPFSHAGKRLGTADERHLWPEMLRIIREISPRWLWARTFAALLIGREGWYSTRCFLIWRLRGMRRKRLYFLLQVSTRRTKESGAGLLPTPKKVMPLEKSDVVLKKGRIVRKSGNDYGVNLAAIAKLGLLNGKEEPLNPQFSEVMMGYPPDWTKLETE